MDLLRKFTFEEIYYINICISSKKEDVIQELKEYLNLADPDMSEIIHSAIDKLHDLENEEFYELRQYPID